MTEYIQNITEPIQKNITVQFPKEIIGSAVDNLQNPAHIEDLHEKARQLFGSMYPVLLETLKYGQELTDMACQLPPTFYIAVGSILIVILIYQAYKLGKSNSMNVEMISKRIKEHKLTLRRFQERIRQQKKYQVLIKKLHRIICFGVFCSFLATTIQVYLQDSDQFNSSSTNKLLNRLKSFLAILHENLFLYGCVACTLIILNLIKKIINYREKVAVRNESAMSNEKLGCINEFFDQIGPEMKDEINNYVKKKTEEDIATIQAQLEATEKENQTIASRNDHLEKKANAYVRLTEALSRFVWCKDCGALGTGSKKRRSEEPMTPENKKKSKKSKRKAPDATEEDLEACGLEGKNLEKSEVDTQIESHMKKEMRRPQSVATGVQYQNEDSDEESDNQGENNEDMYKQTVCKENCLKRYFTYCARAGNDFKQRLEMIE